MADGNSQTDGQPTNDVSAPTIMSSLVPGAFGVTEITSPIISGLPGDPAPGSVPMPVELHHHPIRILPQTLPMQDTDGARDKGVC